MNHKDLINLHKALGEETRYKIVEYIKKHPDITVDDLAKVFNLSKPTLSFHMKKLNKANLLLTRKQKRIIYYTIDHKTLNDSHNLMGELVRKANENQFKFEFHWKEICSTFLLYSDPVRFKIFSAILHKQGISGKEIKAKVRESESNISFHLDKLIEGNIVVCRKIGNQHYYWVNEGFLLAFHNYLERERKQYK